jgi:hypothetical protein
LLLPFLAVILSEEKDPDTLTHPKPLEPSSQYPFSSQNKLQNLAHFPPPHKHHVQPYKSPQLHHIHHVKNHVLQPEDAKTPCKTTLPPQQKKPQKIRRPRNRLSDFEAISSQTARKPNSVLDDHSSTRRITAAL